jgi:hypothetical protein
MTPISLQHLLTSLHQDLPPLHAQDLLASLERVADEAPGDAALRAAVLAVSGYLSAPTTLRPVVGGVRRERLVRWDDWTTTWIGVDVHTGGRAMVRAPRPHISPVLRRALLREGHALRAILPGLWVHEPECCLTLPLPHPVYRSRPHGGSAHPDALVPLVVRSLHVLGDWESAGLAPSDPSPLELCDAGDHLYIATLTLADSTDLSAAVTLVAEALEVWWDAQQEHPLANLVRGLLTLASTSATEAASLATGALASHLADLRWELERRQLQLRRASRAVRLRHAVESLVAAMPAPVGVGAVGVDMEGSPLVVTSDGSDIVFGTSDDQQPLLLEDGRLNVSVARHLVRSRASAPISPRLNHEVGGKASDAERLSRWTTARLDLRTLRLLLSLKQS